MNLLVALEQTRPVLCLQVLLAEDHLDVGGGVVGLGVLYIDLGIELKFEMICCLLRFRGTGECKFCGSEIELERFRWYIRHADCEVDVVLLCIGLVRALRPEDCNPLLLASSSQVKSQALQQSAHRRMCAYSVVFERTFGSNLS